MYFLATYKFFLFIALSIKANIDSTSHLFKICFKLDFVSNDNASIFSLILLKKNDLLTIIFNI